MTQYEGVNGLPPKLVKKLLDAKDWYDNTPAAGMGIRSALMQEEHDREGVALLNEIVEIIDETWGF